jgi:hypothetical protein
MPTFWRNILFPSSSLLHPHHHENLKSHRFNICPVYLTLWNRVLLEKLIVAQLVKKFPAVYGTRRFITMFTACHWSCPEPYESMF